MMSLRTAWKVAVALAVVVMVGACAPMSPEVESVPERAEEPAPPTAGEKPAEPAGAVIISEGRTASYETAAAGTLRSLAAAQVTFVARCVVDQDGDGAGEYGFLQELTGACVPRTRAAALLPGEVLSTAMSVVNTHGVVAKTGYCYIVYLPTQTGPAVAEAANKLPAADAADADPQETRWIAYAWPRQYGVKGKLVFAINQNAEVYAASNQRTDGTPLYTGDGTGVGDVIPTAAAVLAPDAGRPENLESWFPEPGQKGCDGQEWVRLEQ